MKITKDSTVSISLLALIIPAFLWFNNTKADKEEVKEAKVKIQENAEELNEKDLLDLKQTMIIEKLDKKLDMELAR